MVYYDGLNTRNRYNRSSSVGYALNYALNPNPEFKFIPGREDGGGDCTNFVSQCLRAGGAPFSYGASPWWYNFGGISPSDDRWSISWSVAHSLYWTLKTRNKPGPPGLRSVEVNDIQLLELGDLIQYEDKNGSIYHSAIVTDFTLSGGVKVPLISQHSYNGRNVTHIKEKARRMHFMKIAVI